ARQSAMGTLCGGESRQLVESVLIARPATDTVVTRILGRGEGNPLFLEELARSVREQSNEAAALAVPGTVHDIIAMRVEGLAAADEYVVDVAAVIDRDVPVSLLQEACELSGGAVRGSLGVLLL